MLKLVAVNDEARFQGSTHIERETQDNRRAVESLSSESCLRTLGLARVSSSREGRLLYISR
jgi:hypothetical protein